jgi:hypothetical protein
MGIKVPKNKFDINFLFYTVLKTLNSTNGLSDSQVEKSLQIVEESQNLSTFKALFENRILNKIRKADKKDNLLELLSQIENKDSFEILIFSLQVLKFKPLLFEYSKVLDFFSLYQKDKFQLTLKRDFLSRKEPYAFRVNGALIVISFFQSIQQEDNSIFSSEYSNVFVQKLFKSYKKLKEIGLEADSIFNIMFQEGISQSIKSTAGSGLEELVEAHLLNLGISNLDKKHDSKYQDLEYDHFFEFEKRKFGISTKRTLRERYKQFKKLLNSEADIFIHITSGLDLNEAKAKTITSEEFGCYIFVYPEIYEQRKDLKDNSKVFSTLDLKLETLQTLT